MQSELVAEAIRICGSQETLAKRCGVTQAAVSLWLRAASRISAERALAIEAATDGQVPKHRLRPDLWTAPRDPTKAA